MKKNLRKHSKRAVSAVLTALFLSQQSMILSAVATEITAVNGNNGVYDVNPTAMIKNTDIGYRKYQRFELSQGDIANLIFKYGVNDINTFVNLVDNTIKIDGIVNSMRDGNFYNGKAVFVSPNGMIVGASGVLNVGSLGVYTPAADVYDRYKNNPSSNLSALSDINNVGTGAVAINGMVIAANDIDIVSSRIEVPGKMAAGTGNTLALDGRQRAEELFNSIVNTSNIHKASDMVSRNGVISFASTVGTNVSGDVQNLGTGSTNITNIGRNGVDITGNVANHNGDLNINNSNGSIYVGQTGRVSNSGGKMTFINTGKGIYIVDQSKVSNNGDMYMYNSGNEGIHISGTVENNGNSKIENTNDILSISGEFKNTNGNAELINTGRQLNVTGNVSNTVGKLTMTNTGSEGLNIVNTANVSAEGLEMTNSGNDGLNIHGNVTNNGDAKITNTEGGKEGLNVHGTVDNKNGSLELNNAGYEGLNVYGTVKNANGQTDITNSGAQGLTVSHEALIDTQGLNMTNSGSRGFNVFGTVNNEGDGNYTSTAGTLNVNEAGKMSNKGGTAKYYNSGKNGLVISGTVDNEGTTIATNDAGPLSIGGTFTNKGDSTFTNNGSQLNVSGTVNNSNGKLSMTNNGVDGFNVIRSGKINAEGLEMTNTGHNGMNINGTVTNKGNATIANSKDGVGGLNIGGTVTNKNGELTIKNDGYYGLNVKEGGLVDAQGLTMENNGANGLNVRGTVKNKGNGNYKSTAGALDVHETGKMYNTDGTANYYNSGENGLVISGLVENKGTTVALNDKGYLSIGGTFTNQGDSTFTNNGSQLNIHGTVNNSGGKLTMTNNGADGFHVVSTGSVNAQGLKFTNNGEKGMDIHGKIVNDGDAEIINTEKGTDGLSVYSTGSVDNKNGKLIMTNDGKKGLNVYGTVKNVNGQTVLTNNGEEGLNVGQKGLIDTQGLEMTNNGAWGLNVFGTVNNQGDGKYTSNAGALDVHETGKMSNKGGNATYYNKGENGLVISGTVDNEGTTIATNDAGPLSIGGTFTNKGASTFTNNGTQLNVSGTVNNTDGKLTMVNNGAEGFNVISTGKINSEGLSMTNNGADGLNINGTVTNVGNASITNTAKGDKGLNIAGTVNNSKGVLTIDNKGAGGLNVHEGGKVISHNLNKDSLKMTNSGEGGLYIRGEVDTLGNSDIINTKDGTKGLYIIGKSTTVNGNATYKNDAEGGMFVYGEARNTVGQMTMTNTGEKGLNVTKTGWVFADNLNMTNSGHDGLNINGQISTVKGDITNLDGGVKGLNVNGRIDQGIVDPHAPRGYLNLTNYGKEGLNVRGNIHAYDEITTTNVGADGTYIDSKARISGEKSISINDASQGGTRVHGLVNAKENVVVNEQGGNVVIGDKTDNDNYITAGKNITMKVKDGSVLNYGVEKVLLNAGGDLSITVQDGTIGLPVAQTGCVGSGCVGIGPKSEGARDFTKSINGNIKGKVNEQTIDTTVMKEKDFVINYAAIDSDMNIDTIKADGRVILTVDDDYGDTNTGSRYNMVNVKTDNNTTNIEGKGISLIANGSIGTTSEDGTTKPVTFIQTGAEQGYSMDALANENIYLKENSFNDENYGRDKEITANSVCTMIAREGNLDVEFAGNTTIENITAEGDLTVVTRGKNLEITNLGNIKDENVTPNDYFGPRDYGQKDGGYMEEDHRDEALPNTATVKALDINHNLRPTDELVDEGHEAWADSTVKIKHAVLDNGKMDVTADNIYANGIELHINKDGVTKLRNDETEKVAGSDGIPTGRAVRPSDVEKTGRDELERNYYYHAGDGDGNYNGVPSDVDPDDGIYDATPLELEDVVPQNDDNISADGRDAYKRRIDDSNIDNIDKRQYMRFNIADNPNPVLMERSNNVSQLLDVSRGGIAVRHNGTLKVGDVIPVHLTYGDLDIQAQAKVVSATTSRAGAEFVNIDKALANQLLYLNMLLETQYNKMANNNKF